MSRPVLFQPRELLPFIDDIPLLDHFGVVNYRRLSGQVSATRNDKKAEVKISASGVQDLYNPVAMGVDSVVDIASIGKQFTAATLLKLCDEEAFAQEQKKVVRKNFPQGIDTPISYFMEGLKARFPQPECVEALHFIEANENYEKIRLRDLLNHTHGLGFSDNINSIMLNGDFSPMQLHEILGAVTRKGRKEYGEFNYGGPGPDIAAMIIEVITGKSFDDAVRDVILIPNQLNGTYPQVHAVAQFGVNEKMAQGRMIFGFGANNPDNLAEFLKVFHMNSRPNTRAASGFKTTMSDLIKFADLFMGGQMFESKEIKDLIGNREGEVHAEKFSYHLAIMKADGSDFVGHSGGSYICKSDLSYKPETGEVMAYAQVLENVTYSMSAFIFQTLFPDHKSFLENNGELRKLSCAFHEKVKGDMPEEKKAKILQKVMEQNPQGADLFCQYAAIVADVLEHHSKEHKEVTEEMLSTLIKKAETRRDTTTNIVAKSVVQVVESRYMQRN